MADVAAALSAWSPIDSNNSPAGTVTVGAGLDENIRAVQGVLVRGLSNKGSDIAASSTTDLGAVEGLMHDLTGTTTISSFGTVRTGIWKILRFTTSLTLTHNATSLILLSGGNRTTANGDVGIYFSLGSGNWQEIAYTPSGGGVAPVGTVLSYAGSTAPNGWLMCYGQAVSRATYAALFAAISTTYGSGDGSTTFNLPDLRGRVAAGKDDMGGSSAGRLSGASGITGTTLGSAGGEATHTLTGAESGTSAHSHSASTSTSSSFNASQSATGTPTYLGNASSLAATNTLLNDFVVTVSSSSSTTVNNSSAASASSAHNTVQPTLVLNSIIKF